ncbi:MAG: PD-(D/E)XK nuclease family protein, partial [Solirubrobacteraceae bacterium]|nr:PD-(D/E)XK nuclease family protein [Solirubrobacteraceae bacterium]
GRALRPELAAPAPAAAGPSGEAAAPDAPPALAPPALAPPAEPAAPAAPAALSYTALELYRRCGYRFHVQRVLGLPDRPAPPGAQPADAGERGGLSARVRGVVVHALLEELDLGAPARPPDPDRIRALARREGARAGEADVQHVARLVAALSASEPGRRLAAARRLRREHEFAFTLDGELLVGVVDALAVEPDGGWLVVDFKTDRLPGDADVEALVARDYAIQRDLYALAALRAGAPRVEVVHLFLERPDAPASAAFGPGDVAALEARVRALTGPLARGEHPLAAHPHAGICATCPARGGPCPYPEELTLRREGHGPPAVT